MRVRWYLLALFWGTLAAGPGRAEMLNLTQKSKTDYVIVTQAGATEAEKYAAQELAFWLKRATGATFPVRPSQTKLPDKAILIGPGEALSQLRPDLASPAFGAEEGRIITQGHRLLLTGGRPRGTLYAVYRFLYQHVGIRWWAPWATTVPRVPNLSLTSQNETLQPAFESRDPYWFLTFDGDWAARNGTNGQSARLTEKHGGKVAYKGFVHTFYPLVPPEKHFAAHPEWYSLLNGKRVHDHAQLCTTNPQLRAFLVEQVRAWLKESPDARIVSISQNDWYNACQCPDCKAIDDREGSHSGTMLTLVNYVAEKLGPEFPQVAFDTLAYQYTRQAPKTISPLPNVIVRLCSIECNFAAPLEDASNQAFANDIRAWSQKSQRLYIWDYTTNFAHYLLPHPNWFALGPNVRFFAQHGVKGLFEQGAYQSQGAEMAELRAWVLAQLLWNPQQDEKALITEFLNGYYGPAAGPLIGQYLREMAEAAQGFYLTCFSSLNAPFLNFSTLARAERLWLAAEQVARANPDYLWRVRLSHQSVRYAFLAKWSQLRRECRESGGTWPLSSNRAEVAREWLAVLTGPGPQGWQPVTHINEGGITPQRFAERFLREVTPEPPPTDITVPQGKRILSVQEPFASLYQEGTLVTLQPDKAASNGKALRMPGTHREWAIQFRLSELPEEITTGRWAVYVVARVEAKPAASAEKAAFTAGVYDAGVKQSVASRTVLNREASDRYVSYRLGGVEPNLNQYVWIAPEPDTGVEALWVDRLVFVQE